MPIYKGSTPIAGEKANTLRTSRAINGIEFNGSTDIANYGVCSTAAATVAKTVDITNFKLVTGAMITIKWTVTNTASNPTLNVSGTGDILMRYRNGSFSAGYLAANRLYTLVYDGTYWQIVGDLDTNDQGLQRLNSNQKAGASAVGNQIIGFKTDNLFYPLTAGMELDITKPVARCGGSVSENSITNNTYVYYGGGFDLRTTLSGFTGVQYSVYYLKGTLNGNILTLANDFLTCTKPTSDDGYVYMVMGWMPSTTSGSLFSEHPIFQYKDGKFQLYGGSGGGTGDSYRPPLLSSMWSDHILNDIQWLRADTFSWQSGDVYKAAYEKLLEEYSTGVEETYSSDGLVFKRTSSGFKICDASQESKVLERYNKSATSRNYSHWFYILDTANKRFKLPRTQWGFKGLSTNVGDIVDESLPNIKGSINGRGAGQNGTYNSASGALALSGSSVSYTHGASSASGATMYNSFSLNASNSSSTYQDNAPVKENATQMYLYFYVGNFVQTAGITSDINIGQISEALNDKADRNLQNIDDVGGGSIKMNAMEALKPDYTAGISISNNFVAPTNGVIYVDLGWSKDLRQASIDNVLFVAQNNTSANGQHSAGMCIAPKGSVFRYNKMNAAKFFPLKGVN